MQTLDDFVVNKSYHKYTFAELRKEYFKLKNDIADLKKEKVELLELEKNRKEKILMKFKT